MPYPSTRAARIAEEEYNMNTVREIEETSTRLHNLIYNEINALLEKISQEAAGNEQNNVINIFESVYPLSVNIAFLVSGEGGR